MEKIFQLKNLDSPELGVRIKEKISTISVIKDVTVDFSSQKLRIKIDKGEYFPLEEVKKTLREEDAAIEMVDISSQGFKEEFYLQNLGCANCAAKMEEAIWKLDEVEFVSVDFITKRLRYNLKEGVSARVARRKIQKIVQEIEPYVRLSKEEKPDTEEGGLSPLIQLLVGAILFSFALLFPLNMPFEEFLFLISYLIVGYSVLWQAVLGVKNGNIFNENFLMSIATLGAFAIGEYAEAVGVMAFYLVGEILQDKAVDRSRKSISQLMDIRPSYAWIKKGDHLEKTDPSRVSLGQVILVKPGEKIPLDGRVKRGESLVDTSALTGESLPRMLKEGDKALSAFINGQGILEIEVDKTFEDSTVSRILELVENASSKKARTEKFISKFARYYTPLVVFSALILAFVMPLVLREPFNSWLYRALVFLVISCPCALVLSIPLGFFGGIGAASKNGILIKGGGYLEALYSVEHFVFDKTGTLTHGNFLVEDYRSVDELSREEVFKIGAYGESQSNHPIAKSIVKEYGKEIDLHDIQDYNEIPGHGIKARIFGKETLLGNEKLMRKYHVSIEPLQSTSSLVYIAVEGKWVGWIAVGDKLKEDSLGLVKKLKKLGIETCTMLTGDRKEIGEKVAADLDMDKVYSELLPQDKVGIMEKLQEQKNKEKNIAFLGDGINDAPVLAMADVGIAMGALGSDAAIEAADIVIMTDEPSKVLTALKIAKKTRFVVLENIFLALGIKAIFLLLAFFGLANMWMAVFADVGVALIAILNSIRTLYYKDDMDE